MDLKDVSEFSNVNENSKGTKERTYDVLSGNRQSNVYATLESEGSDDKENQTKPKRALKSKKRAFILFAAVVILVLIVASLTSVVIVLARKDSNAEDKTQEVCDLNAKIPNGKIINSTGSEYGDIAEIECKYGHKILGEKTIICLSSGKWTEIPQCIPKQCNKLDIPFTEPVHTSDSFPVIGTQVTIKCQEGYETKGNKTVICRSDETWSNLPVCQPVDCGIPSETEYGQISSLNGTTYNNSFRVVCVEGYFLNGNKSVNCLANGQWSSVPDCKAVSCGLPNIPRNASITAIDGTVFNRTVSFQCKHGFVLHGNDTATCQSNGEWTELPTCELTKDTDCYDVLNKENNAGSGVYSVNLWKSKRTIKVYCDMNTDNGGWTVLQYRFNGSVDFYRNFSEYETGFGNLETEFWLGLKSVKEMASQGKTELRLDLTAADDTTAYETFQNFYLDEGPNYTLHIDPGTGTAGDSSRGLSYNNGHHFSTYDADRDGTSSLHCAVSRHGGWWYGFCTFANLNGEYVTPGTKRPGEGEGGMTYRSFQSYKSLKAVKMMFRRV